MNTVGPNIVLRFVALLAVAWICPLVTFAQDTPATDPDWDYERALASFTAAPVGSDHFDRFVEEVAHQTGDSLMPTKLRLFQQIGEIREREERWAEAYQAYVQALQLARNLEQADASLDILLGLARVSWSHGPRERALDFADQALEIALPLGQHEAAAEAWCLQAQILFRQGRKVESFMLFDRAAALPGIDRFSILAQKGTITAPEMPEFAETHLETWTQALTLAKTEKSRPRQAQAHAALGRIAASQNRDAAARFHFDQAEELGRWENETRPWPVVRTLVRLHRQDGDVAAARAMLLAAKETPRFEEVVEIRTELTHLLAEIEAEAGNWQAAYELLASLPDDLAAAKVTRMTFAPVSLTPASMITDSAESRDLASVRNALREAELARTQARHRQSIATGTAAAMLALVLGLAFLLKRRAAAVARLEAQNAQLETLRYQLNPHFLFNSLANLNGLILTAPDKARVAVRRLSDFCRLALTRRKSPLVPVSEEAERLRAYLDVAAAAEDDDLFLTCDVDPATHDIEIPPLLFQPLVENALKYADEDDTDHRRVTITIRSESPTTLRIEITNTGPWIEATAATAKPSTGVGLTNLRARLAHAYPNRHTLTFTKTATTVTATLTLHTG